MITLEVFLMGLLITSTLTGLVTEAVKKIFTEHKKSYHANTLAGIIAALLSIAIGVSYVIMTDNSFNAQAVVCIIAQVFLSWLCAMVGYDKVIGMFNTTKKGE